MNSRAPGFSLIELLIVAVLSTVVMGAIYQTLTVQQKTNRQINAVVTTQQTLRTSMQFLQSELRELGTTTGDVVAASPTSLSIRAMRKVGIVCDHNSDGSIDVYSFGGSFKQEDRLLLYADLGDDVLSNDTIRLGQINATPSAATSSICNLPGTHPWTSMNVGLSKVNLVLASGSLADVPNGALIRSYTVTTYGLFQKDSAWVLGLRGVATGDTVVKLIGPLAPPSQGGLLLTYFDTADNPIAAANLAANLQAIGSVQLKLRGSTPGAGSSASPVYSDSLVTNVYLRGNP